MKKKNGINKTSPRLAAPKPTPILNPIDSMNKTQKISFMRGVDTLYLALHLEHLKRKGVPCFNAIQNVKSEPQFSHFIIAS